MFFTWQQNIWTLDIWPDSVYAYGIKQRVFFVELLDLFIKVVYQNCDAVFISCKGFKQKIEKYSPDVKIIFSPQWVTNDLKFKGVKPHNRL